MPRVIQGNLYLSLPAFWRGGAAEGQSPSLTQAALAAWVLVSARRRRAETAAPPQGDGPPQAFVFYMGN